MVVMKLKSGIDIVGLRPETLLGMTVVDGLFRLWVEEMTVTSVCDGAGIHARKSLHHVGFAFDCRWPESIESHDEIVRLLRERLGPQFDVVGESDHIHVEFQPKR